MLRLGPLSARISIEGVDIDTHDIQVSEDRRTATGWVASEEKRFCITVKHEDVDATYNVQVFLDGVLCINRVLRSDDVHPVTISAVRNGSTERPLMFSKLLLTDDDAYLNTLTMAVDIGTIKLEFKRVTIQQIILEGGDYAVPDRKIHERSKKAGSHHVKLGDEVPCVRTTKETRVMCRPLDQTPCATLVFKYRPLDLLRAAGIVPLPPHQKRQRSLTLDGDTELQEECADPVAVRCEIEALEKRLDKLRSRAASSRKKRRVEVGLPMVLTVEEHLQEAAD